MSEVKKNRIEEAHAQYLAEPNTENLQRVLKELEPMINYNLVSRGIGNDPGLRNKAKIYAIRAIKSYQPDSKAQLGTWVSSNLRQLSRAKRQRLNTIAIPERAQLENLRLFESESELYDKLHREPTLEELADYTSLPVKTIENIRRMNKKTPADSAFVNEAGEHVEVLGQTLPSYQREALDYLYKESDYVDKKLMEHRIGYGGKPPKSLEELAPMLKTSVPTLSRRSKALAFRIEDTQKQLESIL